ncbi:MAG: hypothetical protein E6Q67_00665 [Roseateles sp.]|nr:MAG: hypothetical protein E6Q67_00665 [Roseateles sp.]
MKNLRQFAKQSPLIIFGGSFFIAGVVLGAAAATWVSFGTTAQLRAGLVEANGREQALTDLLRTALNNQAEDSLLARPSGLASAPGQPLQAQAAASSPGAEASQPTPTTTVEASATRAPAPRPTAAPIQKAAVSPATPSAQAQQKAQPHTVASPAPTKQAASSPAEVPPAIAQAAVAASPAPSTPTATVAATPPPHGRLEAVTAAKAQVEALDKGWVRMTSGLTIRVNEKFPSGETLISVDPTKSQIVTDRRVLLIL